MWALVQSGAVAQVFTSPSAFTVNGVNYPASWFDETTDEQKAAVGVFPLTREPDPIPAGMFADSSTYEIQPTLVIEHLNLVAEQPFTPEQLKSYANDKESRVEQGGIAFNGESVPTTRDAQGIYSRAAAYAALANPISRLLHSPKADGGFMTLSLEQAAMLSRMVEEHVLLSFDAAATIYREIDSGVITTTAEIDESPLWPANG